MEIITTAQMYWLTRLTPLKGSLSCVIGLLFVVAITLLAAGMVMQDDDLFSDETNKRGRKLVKASPFMAATAIVIMFVRCLVPTTKEWAAILIVPRIANSEKVQTVGNHLYDLAVEWMEELRPAKNKQGGDHEEN